MAKYMLPEIVIYTDKDFQGESLRTNLDSNLGSAFNDKISSIVVVSGTWQFFRHADYGKDPGDADWILTPGKYPWVGAVGIPNDQITSFRAVSDTP